MKPKILFLLPIALLLFTLVSPVFAVQVSQPIQATSTYGTQQTITVSSCNPSPATFAGDGGSHSITLDADCVVTLTLPANYVWAGTGTSTETFNSCHNGTCSLFADNYGWTLPTFVACTWFQWQCWWYPLVFFMVYAVVFMFVGALGGASTRGMNFLLFAGLTNASVAATAMGMLTPAVPVLLLVLTVAYMVRFR